MRSQHHFVFGTSIYVSKIILLLSPVNKLIVNFFYFQHQLVFIYMVSYSL